MCAGLNRFRRLQRARRLQLAPVQQPVGQRRHWRPGRRAAPEPSTLDWQQPAVGGGQVLGGLHLLLGLLVSDRCRGDLLSLGLGLRGTGPPDLLLQPMPSACGRIACRSTFWRSCSDFLLFGGESGSRIGVFGIGNGLFGVGVPHGLCFGLLQLAFADQRIVARDGTSDFFGLSFH